MSTSLSGLRTSFHDLIEGRLHCWCPRKLNRAGANFQRNALGRRDCIPNLISVVSVWKTDVVGLIQVAVVDVVTSDFEPSRINDQRSRSIEASQPSGYFFRIETDG